LASRGLASIRPSVRTSSGIAGLSSTMRASRRALRRAPSARFSRARAASTNHAATSTQAARSSPASTSAVGVNVMPLGYARVAVLASGGG
jgi:hypothetical protein